MTESLVRVEVAAGIARITLNDAERLNALSLEMAESLLAALQAVEAKARVIVLSGTGRAFCSGANLSGVAGEGEKGVDPGALLLSHFNPIIRKVRNLSIPLITAVNGAAAGYGASLALAGDLIVASENAYFLQAFRNIGLVPDGGAAFTLVKAIGRVRAAELMLLAEKLPVTKALEWGLVTRVVAREALQSTVDSLAQNLASGATIALGLTRQMLWAATESSFEEQLVREVANQSAAGATGDHREGIAAFLAKRAAAFTGR